MSYLKLTPAELINRAGSPDSQKELSKQAKIVFAGLVDKYSSSARNNMFAALRHFLALNEIQLPLIGLKIKHQLLPAKHHSLNDSKPVEILLKLDNNEPIKSEISPTRKTPT